MILSSNSLSLCLVLHLSNMFDTTNPYISRWKISSTASDTISPVICTATMLAYPVPLLHFTCSSSIVSFWTVFDLFDTVSDIKLTRFFTQATITTVTVSSYMSGLMTEFKGRIIIEKTLYQGVASRTPTECRIQMMMNGTQHKKSVVIIQAIL